MKKYYNPRGFLEVYLNIAEPANFMFNSIGGRWLDVNKIDRLMKKLKITKECAVFILINDDYDIESVLFIWYVLVEKRISQLKIWPVIGIHLIYKLYIDDYYYPITFIDDVTLNYLEDASDGYLNLKLRWFNSFGSTIFAFKNPIVRSYEWFVIGRQLVHEGELICPSISDELIEKMKYSSLLRKKLMHSEFMTKEQINRIYDFNYAGLQMVNYDTIFKYYQ